MLKPIGFLVLGLCLAALCGCGGSGSVEETSSDTSSPYVVDVSPKNGITGVPTNQPIVVKMSEAIDPGSISGSTFLVSAGGSTIAMSNPVVNNDVITAFPTGSYPTSATVKVVMKKVKDLAGNVLEDAEWSFSTNSVSTDTTAPSIVTFSPTGSNVALDIQPVVTFSESIDPNSVNSGNLQILNGSTPVSVTWVVNGNQATIKPAANLAASTVYTISVGATVKDLAGNPLPASQSSSFTTATSPVVTPTTLGVSTTFPTSNAAGVALDAKPSITFTKALDPATVTNGNFSLTSTAGSQITAALSLATGNTAVLFTPTVLLAASTTYTATASANVKASDGSTMPVQYSFSFTTGSGSTPSTGGPTGATFVDPKGVVAAAMIDSTHVQLWLKKDSQPAPKPFIIDNFNNWQKQALPAFDANGWTSVDIGIPSQSTVRISLAYGNDYGTGLGNVPNGTEVWSAIAPQSGGWHETEKNIQIVITGNSIISF